jgi:hypothetical protein
MRRPLSFQIRRALSVIGTKRTIQPRPRLSAIGATVDNGGFWPAMVCPLMTQSGHRANLLHRTRAASRPRDVCLFLLSFWEPKFTVNNLVGERLMDSLVTRLNIEHYCKAAG